MSNEVDIRENDILQQDPVLLETILIDHSRPKNGKKCAHIIWATDNYESLGPGYGENEQISIPSITGDHGSLIQPRVKKTKEEQQARARDKGEVFTPAWICNKQNNLVDNEWFGVSGLFNEETDTGWTTNPAPIPFPTKDGKTWQDYVNDTRLEITCGEAPFLVVCESIQDPHNLGAILRTAECAGVHGVIISKHSAVGLTDVVAKTAAGALEYVPVAKVSSVAKLVDDLKKRGIWTACADMDGTSIYQTDLKGPLALIIGGEHEGITRLVKERCDFVVSLPMKGHVTSLNASVAAGILMYEAAHQRDL